MFLLNYFKRMVRHRFFWQAMKQVQKIFFIHIHGREFNIPVYDVMFFLVEPLIFREFHLVLNLLLVHLLMILLDLERLRKLINKRNQSIHMGKV